MREAERRGRRVKRAGLQSHQRRHPGDRLQVPLLRELQVELRDAPVRREAVRPMALEGRLRARQHSALFSRALHSNSHVHSAHHQLSFSLTYAHLMTDESVMQSMLCARLGARVHVAVVWPDWPRVLLTPVLNTQNASHGDQLSCECKPGFGGDRCEQRLDICKGRKARDDCALANNGSCRAIGDALFVCTCPKYYWRKSISFLFPHASCLVHVPCCHASALAARAILNCSRHRVAGGRLEDSIE